MDNLDICPLINPAEQAFGIAESAILVHTLYVVTMVMFRRAMRRARPSTDPRFRFATPSPATTPLNKRQRRNAARRAARLAVLTAAIAAELDGQEPPATSPQGPRARQQYPRVDPKLSNWWEYCQEDGGTFADPKHRDGKTFRRRFRVPWAVGRVS